MRSFPLLLALALASLMGFAMQRGSTCAYLAVGEWVRERRAGRLLSLFETAFWVLAIAALLHRLGAPVAWPAVPALGVATVLGGALLGLGAYVNRGCVLGTLAQIGNGNWHFGWTVAGYFLACWLAAVSGYRPPPSLPAPALDPATRQGYLALAVALAPLGLVYGLRYALRGREREAPAPHTWPIHRATVVVGVAFAILLLGVGPWSYTDLLNDLARHMPERVDTRIGLTVALLAGILTGGLSAGRFGKPRAPLATHLRCLAGGLLLGFGGVAIPGGNDTLLLVGLPRALPYAVVGVLTMLATIYLCIRCEARLARGAR